MEYLHSFDSRSLSDVSTRLDPFFASCPIINGESFKFLLVQSIYMLDSDKEAYNIRNGLKSSHLTDRFVVF